VIELIVKLRKTHSHRHIDYVVESDGEKLYTINLPRRSFKTKFYNYETMTIFRNDEFVYKIEFNLYPRKDFWVNRIFNGDGERIGLSYYRRRRSKNSLLAYEYYDFEFKKLEFEFCLAGIDGFKLLIFDKLNDEKIGLSEVPSVIYDSLNEWTIYAKGEQELMISLFSTLTIDYREFDYRVKNRYVKQKKFIATSEEMNNKYNPDFKAWIEMFNE